MRIRVLGSAAGGGFPQWNCGCPNCRGVRAGTLKAIPRTQESVAVSSDGEHWVLLNASPEIRQQIESFPPLHPKKPRHSPIAAIVLTNGDLDHCLGLLSLRENHPLTVYATDRVRRGFTEANVLYRTLERFDDQVTWRALKLGREDELASGLTVEAVPVPGKLPIHLEASSAPDDEDSVGVRIRETRRGTVLAYFSGVGGVTPAVAQVLEDADAVFFDGTFWSEDELPALGVGDKRARDMALPPVLIHACTNGMVAQNEEDQTPSLRHHGQHSVLASLRGKSDLWVDDMDVFFPYDGFSFITVSWIENTGWCGLGEARAFIEDNWDRDGARIMIDGRIPVNPHGGGLSEGGTQGSGHTREAIHQLQGRAGERQVQGASSALVTAGGFFFNAQGCVLRSDG